MTCHHLTPGFTQPTVRFAEDTLLLPPAGEDGESEEGQLEAPWPLPGGRQRLIRKDTPHYKKHFKISKLPQPEAVVALLQGAQPDGEGPAGAGGWHNGPHTPWAPRAEEEDEEDEEEDEEEEEVAVAEEDKEEAVVSAPSIKVGLCSQSLSTPGCPVPAASLLLLVSLRPESGCQGRALPKGCCSPHPPGLVSDGCSEAPSPGSGGPAIAAQTLVSFHVLLRAGLQAYWTLTHILSPALRWLSGPPRVLPVSPGASHPLSMPVLLTSRSRPAHGRDAVAAEGLRCLESGTAGHGLSLLWGPLDQLSPSCVMVAVVVAVVAATVLD